MTFLDEPHVPGHGPIPSPICLVGEAPGGTELVYKRPFVGEAGQELGRILQDANLGPLDTREGKGYRRHYYTTNVFKIKPPDTHRKRNDISEFFVSRTNESACLDLPPHRPGNFLRSELRPMVDGLVPELVGVGAKVVIALGNTALWALLGYSKISSYVGTIHPATSSRPFIVLPTYHPSAILHQWPLRSTMVANLLKVEDCLRQAGATDSLNGRGTDSSFRPTIKTSPTISEIEAFAERAFNADVVAVDVETRFGQIRTVGFSITPDSAFIIPFWEPPAGSYWPTIDGEVRAWKAVKRILSSRRSTKIFHNGSFDIQYLWRLHGIPTYGPIEDTMLAHHAMEPELPKTLGGLAAVYLNMPEWKTMRARSEKDEE